MNKQLYILAKQISDFRKESSIILEEKINEYLKFLYLSNSKIIINEKNWIQSGVDESYFLN